MPQYRSDTCPYEALAKPSRRLEASPRPEQRPSRESRRVDSSNVPEVLSERRRIGHCSKLMRLKAEAEQAETESTKNATNIVNAELAIEKAKREAALAQIDRGQTNATNKAVGNNGREFLHE